MNSRDYFLSRRFFDDKHFPYGFSRSGDFTLNEVKELEKFGNLFCALQSGEVADPSEEDRHFIRLISGETQSESLAEKAWLKYLKCSSRSPVWLTTRRVKDEPEELFIADDTYDFDDSESNVA